MLPPARAILYFSLLPSAVLFGADVTVSSLVELRAAVAAAVPGTKILIAPGEYTGGLYLDGPQGTAEKPVVITAQDPKNPPRFSGGSDGIKLTNPRHTELSHLTLSAIKGNGVNMDDGGKWDPAPRGVVLRGLVLRDIGPKGNFDGLKLSGLSGFRVEDCVIENWGTGSGSAIDMVGCHEGMITGCVFRHRTNPADTGGNGVQMKGGSAGVTVRKNVFDNAGSRALNIGGSTGAPFYRPPLEKWPVDLPKSEARSITVEENSITGSETAVAFVGVDGVTVRKNTIIRPGKWAIRILQETRTPGFAPCRGGVFSENVIVFNSARWGSGGVNVGSDTAPETFRFARNHWYCEDAPTRSRPSLPVPEEEGVYGEKPSVLSDAK